MSITDWWNGWHVSFITGESGSFPQRALSLIAGSRPGRYGRALTPLRFSNSFFRGSKPAKIHQFPKVNQVEARELVHRIERHALNLS